MITFGYKTPWSGIVRSLSALGLGILAVAYPGNVIPLLVQIFAVVLGVYGFGMLAYAFAHKQDRSFSIWLSNAIVEIVVAVLVFIFAGFIARIAAILIGALLLASGIYQIAALISAERAFRFSLWFFVLPAIELILGIVLMSASQLFTETVGMIVGISLIVSGLSELLSSIKVYRIVKQYEKDSSVEEQNAKVEDVETDSEDVLKDVEE